MNSDQTTVKENVPILPLPAEKNTATAPSSVEIPPGPGIDAIVDGYRIKKKIGNGGMGIVYQAVNENIPDLKEVIPVALKIISCVNDQQRERAKREISALDSASTTLPLEVARVKTWGEAKLPQFLFSINRTWSSELDDKCLAEELRKCFYKYNLTLSDQITVDVINSSSKWKIIDQSDGCGYLIRKTGNSTYIYTAEAKNWIYLVMDFVEGLPIDEHARELPWLEKVELLSDLCKIIARLHQPTGKNAKIRIHRDLKPANILVDHKDKIRILDFGLSKALDDDASAKGLTNPGAIIGTPLYMAPEQTQAGNKLSAETDVYALGTLIFEILGGCHPLGKEWSNKDALYRAIREDKPDSLDDRRNQEFFTAFKPKTRLKISTCIDQALANDSQNRPTAEYLAKNLRAALEGESRHDMSVFIVTASDVGEERFLMEKILERKSKEYEGQLEIHHDDTVTPETADIAVIIVCGILEENAENSIESGVNRVLATRSQQGNKLEILLFDKTAQSLQLLDPSLSLSRNNVNTCVEQIRALTTDGKVTHILFASSFEFNNHLLNKLEEYLSLHFTGIRPRPIGMGDGENILFEDGPYRGLEVFEERHAPIYFGRDQEISDILQLFRVQAAKKFPFIIIWGPSGVGKSSFAQAGVLPRLIQSGVMKDIDCWRRAIIQATNNNRNRNRDLTQNDNRTPAVFDIFQAMAEGLAEPNAVPKLISNVNYSSTMELAAALRDENCWEEFKGKLHSALNYENDPHHLLVIIDQMEQIFHQDGVTQKRFGKFLVDLCKNQRVWILATVRNDHYSHFTDTYKKLKSAAGVFDLSHVDDSGLRQIIEEPAKLFDLKFGIDEVTRKPLSELLCKEIQDQPGSLPLLEFTLAELYRLHNRETRLMEAGSYKNENGVRDPLCKVGSNRVTRGGSWINAAARGCRSANRDWDAPSHSYPLVGFRVVLAPGKF